MTTEPVEEPPLILRRDALTNGLVDDEIARLRRRGDWSRLRRGAYVAGVLPSDRRLRHLLVVRATVAALRTPAVVGVGPLVVTSAARTVVDLARILAFAPALAVADAALRSGAATREQLVSLLDRAAGTRGARAARRVVEAADGRSESVGESRSRAVMLQLGLPLPDLQVEVRRRDGALVGRCDFGWEKSRMLGEFDGRVKYGRLLRPGQDWGMVRWVWSELDSPTSFGRRLFERLQ